MEAKEPVTVRIIRLESDQPASNKSAVPVVAFTFLLYAEPILSDVWKRWFARADELGLKYTIHVHNKQPLTDPFWIQYEVKTKTATTWERTVNAQLILWKEAAAQRPDFITLHSGNCIPVQPPEKFWAFMQTQTQTIAPYLKPFTIHSGRERLRTVAALMSQPTCHSQFVALHKSDFNAIFTSDKLPKISALFADNEHVLSIILPKHRLSDYPLTHVVWKKGRPMNFVSKRLPPKPPVNAKQNEFLQPLTPELFELIKHKSYFLRKVGNDLDANLICNWIGI